MSDDRHRPELPPSPAEPRLDAPAETKQLPPAAGGGRDGDRRDHDGRDRDGRDHDGRDRDRRDGDRGDRGRGDDDGGRARRPPPGRGGLLLVLLAAVLVAGLGAGLLFWRHHHRITSEAKRRHDDVDRGPRVFVAEVKRSPAARELTLPADVRGFFQSTIYARTSGYVKSIVVDKGDSVHKGQILGKLESPEVDQQVAAAEADLVIKKRTFERYQKLVARDYVSAQDFDTARAQYDVAQATLKQARALQSYETLRAPFDGTVTARYVDPGALVPAAAGSTQSAQPLVDIADLRRLRITVFVQQDAAPFLKEGDLVDIAVDEQPKLKIKAPIARFAKSIDLRSRTMLCEIWLDNEQRLYPGTFVHVTLHLKMPTVPVAPSAALLLHDNKPALAAIRDSRVRFVPVRTGLDDGKTVQLLEGIEPGEQVALNLPAEIPEGALVRASRQPEGGAAAGAQKPGAGGEQKSDKGDDKQSGAVQKQDKGGVVQKQDKGDDKQSGAVQKQDKGGAVQKQDKGDDKQSGGQGQGGQGTEGKKPAEKPDPGQEQLGGKPPKQGEPGAPGSPSAPQ